MADPAAQARDMLAAVRDAALLLSLHDDTMRRYLDEAALADSVLPIVDPSRWMRESSEPHRPHLEHAVRKAREFVAAAEALRGSLS